MTYDQPEDQIEWLRKMLYPHPAATMAHVPARVRTGGRWHTGYLTHSSGLAIRDSSRSPRSQYVSINRNNVASVELRQDNGRYTPAFPC